MKVSFSPQPDRVFSIIPTPSRISRRRKRGEKRKFTPAKLPHAPCDTRRTTTPTKAKTPKGWKAPWCVCVSFLFHQVLRDSQLEKIFSTFNAVVRFTAKIPSSSARFFLFGGAWKGFLVFSGTVFCRMRICVKCLRVTRWLTEWGSKFFADASTEN